MDLSCTRGLAIEACQQSRVDHDDREIDVVEIDIVDMSTE